MSKVNLKLLKIISPDDYAYYKGIIINPHNTYSDYQKIHMPQNYEPLIWIDSLTKVFHVSKYYIIGVINILNLKIDKVIIVPCIDYDNFRKIYNYIMSDPILDIEQSKVKHDFYDINYDTLKEDDYKRIDPKFYNSVQKN